MNFTYKLTQDPNQVIRSDGITITDITANYGDALLFQAWLSDGNTPLPADPIPVVVREIDARRLRLALLQLGHLPTVTAAVSSLGEAAQIDWEYATIIKEDYPLVMALANNLGLDTDAVFTLAISLI